MSFNLNHIYRRSSFVLVLISLAIAVHLTDLPNVSGNIRIDFNVSNTSLSFSFLFLKLSLNFTF